MAIVAPKTVEGLLRQQEQNGRKAVGIVWRRVGTVKVRNLSRRLVCAGHSFRDGPFE